MTTPDNGSNRPDEDRETSGLGKLSLGQRLLLQLPDLRRGRPSSSNASSTQTVQKTPTTQKTQTAQKSQTAQKAQSTQKKTGPKQIPVATEQLPKPTKVKAPVSAAEDETEEQEAPDTTYASDDETAESALPADRQGKTARSTAAPRSKSTLMGGSNPFESMETPELVQLVKRLDNKERKLALWAVPLGVVLGIVVTIVTVHSNPPIHHKGHEDSTVILTDGALPIAFSMIVFACAWYRRRSLTAFTLLFLGLTIGLIGPGTPFLVLGGYLIFRMFRVQKVLTSRGVNTRNTNARSRGAATSRDAGGRPTRPTRQKRSTPVGPQQSKRYTPPKPPPRRAPVPTPDPDAKPKRSLLERMAERVDRPQE
jgi:hypothetical protein